MVKITKKGKKAWVTFTAPVEEVESVELVGDWNDWTPEVMKQKKSGEFYLTKVLNIGHDYQFGYSSNNAWILDETLGKTESPYGSHNSLLAL
jgi:hypothetical protein